MPYTEQHIYFGPGCLWAVTGALQTEAKLVRSPACEGFCQLELAVTGFKKQIIACFCPIF